MWTPSIPTTIPTIRRRHELATAHFFLRNPSVEIVRRVSTFAARREEGLSVVAD
jgi:hypothetical protein